MKFPSVQWQLVPLPYTSLHCGYFTVFSDETEAKVLVHITPSESLNRSYIFLLHLDLDMNFK